MAGIPSSSRLRVRVTALAAIGSFMGVLAAIEAMALRGQIDFGRQVLHLQGAWLVVPPAALEGGTLAAATLTLWAVLNQDSATLPRLMTAAFIGAASYANYQGAEHAGRPLLAAGYLAGASVAAYLMWHSILTRIRRSELRSAGAIEAPLPHFRLLRWLVAPRETYSAFKAAIRESITRPQDALTHIRPAPAVPPEADSASADEITAEGLTAMAAERGGKRQAVTKACAALNSREPARIHQWLAAYGIEVDLSYISRTVKDQPHELKVVSPEP